MIIAEISMEQRIVCLAAPYLDIQRSSGITGNHEQRLSGGHIFHCVSDVL